ncbi:hypothetical protein AFK65_15880 [Cronobacter universalis NCTC 9529]|uniref:Uncharacterized protein n=1 Tax=Cronobacter universalis NCTC 9529 TaxID=1074000 RepID=A0AAC8VS90_9ENTR|nr:hypothetical protein AFK65_15880 [Cronobacter universalis NCTC 9529]
MILIRDLLKAETGDREFFHQKAIRGVIISVTYQINIFILIQYLIRKINAFVLVAFNISIIVGEH